MFNYGVHSDVIFHRDIRLSGNKTILQCVLEKTFLPEDGDQVVSNVFLKTETRELNLIASILFETLYRNLSMENTLVKLTKQFGIPQEQVKTDAIAFLESLEAQNILIKNS